MNFKFTFCLCLLLLPVSVFSQEKELSKAVKLIEKSKNDKAKVVITEALRAYPDNIALLKLKAELQYKERNREGAKATHLKIISLNNDSESLAFLAAYHYDKKQYKKALPYFDKYHATKPRDYLIRVRWLDAFWQTGKENDKTNFKEEHYELLESFRNLLMIMDSRTRDIVRKLYIRTVYDLYAEAEQNPYEVSDEIIDRLQKTTVRMFTVDFAAGAAMQFPENRGNRVRRMLKEKKETEKKTQVRNGKEYGQIELCQAVFGKFRKLGKSDEWDVVRNHILTTYPDLEINKGYGYSLMIDGRLPDERIIEIIKTINADVKYNRYMTFRHVNSAFYNYRNPDYQRNKVVKVNDRSNRIKLKDQDFADLTDNEIRNLLDKYRHDLGYNLDFQYITVFLNPSGYVFKKERTEKKFRSGGLTFAQNSATWTEHIMSFEPQNKITRQDIERVKKLFDKGFDTRLTLKERELSTTQTLDIYTVADVDEWTFKKGFQSFVKILGDTNNSTTTNSSEESIPRCNYETEPTGKYEVTGDEKSPYMNLKCDGKYITVGNLKVELYERRKYHAMYGQPGIYRRKDGAIDPYLGDNMSDAVKKLCNCR